MKPHIFLPSLAVLFAIGSCSRGETKLNADNIDRIVAQLTLEEKVHLLVGSSLSDAPDSLTKAVAGYTSNLVDGAAGTTFPIERLGITPVVFADGPAGLRISPRREGDSVSTYYCTAFPIGLSLASSWDSDLIASVGAAMGSEVKEYGVDVLLGPGMNIIRNPLCGRNFEYYSEDPLLSGSVAAAMVNGIQSQGVGTSIKHFAANNQEINRLCNDSRVSERALREIYLRNFEIAVRLSQPWTVMTSYNYLNGTQTSENRTLLTDILRNEWGYEGMVVSDWGGGFDPVAQINAGNDNLQSGSMEQYNLILQAARDGLIAPEQIDRCVSSVLRLVARSPRHADYHFSDKPDLAANALVERNAAGQGMVLLENREGALPFESGSRVALFGSDSYDLVAGGTGAGDVNSTGTVGLVEGFGSVGLIVDKSVQASYRSFIATEVERLSEQNSKRSWWFGKIRAGQMSTDSLTVLAALAASSDNDAAIVTIARRSGEGMDRHIDDDFNLTEQEQELIKVVTEQFHLCDKPVCVVLNVAGVVETASWKQLPDAVLLAWLPGQQAGEAVADVLSGRQNPSGRLPVTFPVSYADVPSQNFPAMSLPTDKNHSFYRYSTDKLYEVPDIDYTDYTEDIYVGYRYYQTRNTAVSYPFGYGLSYTTFEVDAPRIRRVGDGWNVTVGVTNSGKCTGRYVVELYVSAPEGQLDKPVRELRAFAKTALLAPAESCTVEMRVAVDDLASFDQARSAWVVDAGDYRFEVADNAAAVLNSAVASVKRESVRPVQSSLAPKGALFLGQ